MSLINTKGRVVVKHNQEFRQIFPKPGWVEHNPDDIWKSVVGAIKAVFAKTTAKPKDVIAIGITNQRETLVSWNRKTGTPVGNAIVWQCRRTADVCQKLKKNGAETSLRKITGLVLDPYFSGSKMQWVLKHNSIAKKLAGQGQLCFGTIDSYLIWKLTGHQVHGTDVSNASRTQLMDLKTLGYSSDMLKLFGVRQNSLPEIMPSAGTFGWTAKVAGLPAGIPITGVVGDQQSALFGQFCFEPGDSKITFGTGSFLLMNTGSKPKVSRSGLLTTVAWKTRDQKKATYALEGGAFICGAAVQWLRDQLGFIPTSKDIEKLAKKVKDRGGVEFVPAFAGLGAPYWDPNVRGALLGLTRGTSTAHIARATLEAIALQNVDIVTAMIKDARTVDGQVKADGGASANKLLMQMQADLLGQTVAVPKMSETTSYGAALMAGLGAGVWSSLDELRKLEKSMGHYSPQLSPQQRSQRVTEWQKAIKALASYHN